MTRALVVLREITNLSMAYTALTTYFLNLNNFKKLIER